MITPEMIASYVKVFEPETSLNGDLKYSVQLRIPKTDTKGIALLKKAIEKAIEKGKEKKWSGKVPKFRYLPLRDGDAELEDGTTDDQSYAGVYYFNASCGEKDKPQIVGPNARPLMDEGALYSGCWVRADVAPFPYSNSGNHGIGWWLNSLMLLRDGERLDGRQDAADAFAAFATEDTDDNLV